MIREAVFYATLGTCSLWLVASGFEAGSAFGAVQMACGVAASALTIAVMRGQSRERAR